MCCLCLKTVPHSGECRCAGYSTGLPLRRSPRFLVRLFSLYRRSASGGPRGPISIEDQLDRPIGDRERTQYMLMLFCVLGIRVCSEMDIFHVEWNM